MNTVRKFAFVYIDAYDLRVRCKILPSPSNLSDIQPRAQRNNEI